MLFEQCTMGELIYVVSEGEFDIVRELAYGGEEFVKVAGPGDYFGDIGRCRFTCRVRRRCGPEPTRRPSATRRRHSVSGLARAGCAT